MPSSVRLSWLLECFNHVVVLVMTEFANHEEVLGQSVSSMFRAWDDGEL